MALRRIAQKSFGRGEVSPLAEPKLDGVVIAVDGAVQVWELEEQFLLTYVKRSLCVLDWLA